MSSGVIGVPLVALGHKLFTSQNRLSMLFGCHDCFLGCLGKLFPPCRHHVLFCFDSPCIIPTPMLLSNLVSHGVLICALTKMRVSNVRMQLQVEVRYPTSWWCINHIFKSRCHCHCLNLQRRFPLSSPKVVINSTISVVLSSVTPLAGSSALLTLQLRSLSSVHLYVGRFTNALLMKCNVFVLFGETYIPMHDVLLSPDTISNPMVFGPWFCVLSSCHCVESLWANTTPPCLGLTAFVA